MAARLRSLAALGDTLIRRETIDLRLDRKQLVNAAQSLNGERGLPQLGQLVELPASVTQHAASVMGPGLPLKPA